MDLHHSFPAKYSPATTVTMKSGSTPGQLSSFSDQEESNVMFDNTPTRDLWSNLGLEPMVTPPVPICDRAYTPSTDVSSPRYASDSQPASSVLAMLMIEDSL